MGRNRATPAAVVATAEVDICCCCGGSGKVVVLGVCPLCDGIGHFADIAEAPKLSNKAAKARAKDVSQSLSLLLRHQAREKGVSLDEQGWVLLSDALKVVNDVPEDDEPWEGGPVTLDEVHAVVGASDKQRFHIWEQEPPLIRAVQGHTMEGINPYLSPLSLEETPMAVHGTYHDAWGAIKTVGLSKMSRYHIHLANNLPGQSGVVTGMRASCEVLIWVDLARAAAAGMKFMEAANGCILTDAFEGVIGPEFFAKVLDRKTNASLL